MNPVRRTYLILIATAALIAALALAVDAVWSPNASLDAATEKLQSHIRQREQSFQKLVSDSGLIAQIRSGKVSDRQIEDWTRNGFSVYLFDRDSGSGSSPVFWSSSLALPPAELAVSKEKSGLIHLKNGQYVWNAYSEQGISLICLIPVRFDFFVTNEYLKNEFVAGLDSANFKIITDLSQGKPLYSIHGPALFSLQRAETEKVNGHLGIYDILIFTSLICFLVFFHLFLTRQVEKSGLLKGSLFFILIVGCMRLLTLTVFHPVELSRYGLFDNRYYSSVFWMGSLGDFIVNLLLGLWFLFFVRLHAQARMVRISQSKVALSRIFMLAGALLIVASTFFSCMSLQQIVRDERISLDVLNFSSIDFFSLAGFLAIGCLAVFHYFLIQLVFYFLKPFQTGRINPVLILTAIAGLLWLSFFPPPIGGVNYILVLLWLIVFLFLLNNTYLNIIASRVISSRLIFWMFFYAVSLTLMLITENKVREGQERRKYARLLATKADPVNETILNSMLTDFNPEYLSPRFDRLFDSLDNRRLKDSLLAESSISYSEKYETVIFSFTAGEQPLYNANPDGFNQLNTIYETMSRPTGKKGLFYFDESFDKFSYISRIVVKDGKGGLLGYLFVVSRPKGFGSAKLYPELFGRGRSSAIEQSNLYSIAIYRDWRLQGSFNDYPFTTLINPPKKAPLEFSTHEGKNGFDELWHYAGSGNMVIIARQNREMLEGITMFSYVFCSFLLLTLVFWAFSNLIGAVFRLDNLQRMWKTTIRNQVHGTIILLSLFSFLIIGLVTVLIFRNRFETGNREMLSRTIKILERELKAENISPNNYRNDSLFSGLADRVRELSGVHEVDLNLYDLTGTLRASSFLMPYEKGILSSKMDPLAFHHLKDLKEAQYFHKEKISALQYSSIYLPLSDAEGRYYGYLNIPYFTTQSRLKQEISNFMITLINLNAFIFLIAGIVAFFITNKITASFSFIVEKMKKMSLGSVNEPILWERKDEIGALVTEYNKMVKKLDESARILAQSEREGAWREMARQIAHEIKNPLTPMKLSMQYLKRSIENNDPNVLQLTNDMANTLIVQIEHLNQIANEFSQFANIENAKPENVDIQEVLRHVLSLFRSGDQVNIITRLEQGPIMLYADKSHLVRIFTNLLQNAIQSVPEGRSPVVRLEEERKGDSLLIRVIDNGTGIEEDLQPLIFTPNFTTKTSGTGLGLAMCKRMVEQAGGGIGFSTQKGKGTIMTVELPLKN